MVYLSRNKEVIEVLTKESLYFLGYGWFFEDYEEDEEDEQEEENETP